MEQTQEADSFESVIEFDLDNSFMPSDELTI